MPSKYQIASYWASKEGYARWPSNRCVMDVGEPACMACGYYRESWDNGKVAARWERAHLQKAHIVARSAGGADSPENFVLLCDRCHAAAPMTVVDRDMIAWCDRRQSRFDQEAAALKQELPVHELSPADIERLADLSYDDHASLLDRAVKSIGAGTHGSAMTPSTRAAVVAEMARIAARGCAEPDALLAGVAARRKGAAKD